MAYQINFGVLAPYADLFFRGFLLTIGISIAALAISLPLGLAGALLRTSRWPALRILSAVYVEALRNVPLLVVVYVFFYELPSLGIQLDSLTSGVAALSVNSTAYVIEIFRGGLAAIPKGQYEASASLGMRPFAAFRFVILPQLLRVSFPALGNQVVGLILGSSLVAVVGIPELTSVSYKVGSQTFRYFEVFVIAGVFYFVAVQFINRIWVAVGRRWTSDPRVRAPSLG